MINWLFERAVDYKPQLGWASADKRALLWLPGAKQPPTTKRIEQITGKAVLRGCTQMAYESWSAPMGNQRCQICWIGVDIDDPPIYDTDLAAAISPFHGSIRSSCGGVGRHVLVRLHLPVDCHHSQAGAVVKQLARPLVAAIEQSGHRVCKADRRMFWLTGGLQRWIYQCEGFWVAPFIKVGQPVAKKDDIPVTPATDPCGWLQLFKQVGLVDQVAEHNPVYIGDFITVLRSAGQQVLTKSTCRGNKQINGYLDVRPGYIGLWSYADGHTIWCWQSLEAMGL